MNNNYQKTINLKDKIISPNSNKSNRKKINSMNDAAVADDIKKTIGWKANNIKNTKVEEIEKLYAFNNEHKEDKEEVKETIKNEFYNFNHPQRNKTIGFGRVFFIFIIILILVVGSVFYFKTFIFNNKKNIVDNVVIPEKKLEEKWYAVKLVNGELFFGKIEDTTSDPIIIKSAYYNYDQIQNSTSTEQSAGGSLRLVKRGKEAQGGDGSINIVRSQIIYMEPLKNESKVLKAILEYENN